MKVKDAVAKRFKELCDECGIRLLGTGNTIKGDCKKSTTKKRKRDSELRRKSRASCPFVV